MPQYLAVDWDDAECRFVAAGVGKNSFFIEHYGSVPLEKTQQDTEWANLSATLRKVCKDRNIGNVPSVLVLGRHQTDWLYQQLPHCNENEIPILLKNQVLRELPAFADFDPLDYIVLDISTGGCQVLALTMHLSRRQQLTKTFRNIYHPPQRIGFRAVDAAEAAFADDSLWLEGENTVSLIVNTVRCDADLILAVNKQIRSIRSFRLPEDNPHQSLIAEIQRTITAGFGGVDLTPPDLTPQRLILFDDTLGGELASLELDTLVLNPFLLPNVSVRQGVSVTNIPETLSPYVPLIGSLLAVHRKTGIDFLHPKEAPKPPNYLRPVLLAAVCFGILGYALYLWNQGVVQGLEKKLAEVQKEHQSVAGGLQMVQPGWNVLRQTQIWESQNVLWLDVLKDLSQILPNGTDLVVSQMSFTSGAANNPQIKGVITLSGMVRDPQVLRKLHSDLQATQRYRMQSPVPAANPAGGGYPWLFKAAVYKIN